VTRVRTRWEPPSSVDLALHRKRPRQRLRLRLRRRSIPPPVAVALGRLFEIFCRLLRIRVCGLSRKSAGGG
jgi:hypothetical protein